MIAPGSQTSTHHHGLLPVRSDESLGFLRISKCASTFATQYLGVDELKTFEYLRQNSIPVYTVLRDPFERILSSIPETLLRARAEEKSPQSVVLIDEEIFFAISRLGGDPETIARFFVERISSFGPFDAHHEPMTTFMCDSNWNLELPEAIALPIGNINEEFPRIMAEHGLTTAPRRIATNARLANYPMPAGLAATGRDGVKGIARKVLAFSPQLRSVNALRGPRESLPKQHPIAVRAGTSVVTTRQANEAMKSLYRELRESSAALNLLSPFVNAFYGADQNLWAELVRLRRAGVERPTLRELFV